MGLISELASKRLAHAEMLIRRLSEEGFTGQAQIHFGSGTIGCIKTIEHHPIEPLEEPEACTERRITVRSVTGR